MNEWGIPPIEKIYEAFSAVASERVKIIGEKAMVHSSDYKKEYTIEWHDNEYSSNDNASYYQGYLGYPVIAVLMLQNIIKYKPEIATYFKQINWKKLNTKYKNKYAEVVEIILNDLVSEGVNIEEIVAEVNNIYGQIKNLKLIYKRSRHLPPQ